MTLRVVLGLGIALSISFSAFAQECPESVAKTLPDWPRVTPVRGSGAFDESRIPVSDRADTDGLHFGNSNSGADHLGYGGSDGGGGSRNSDI